MRAPGENKSGVEGAHVAAYIVAAGLWVSGALWLVFHHFMMRKTAFGPSPDPLEHWWLVAHGAFAFASLWTLGLLWNVHIVRRWVANRHRLSGGVLLGATLVLMVTGYLLYYVGGDRSRAVIGLIHWGLGLLALLPFLIHWIVRER